ncbi:hypothetical protein ZYGR_0AD05170, partial [Zygosaccharomyces rouxii]
HDKLVHFLAFCIESWLFCRLIVNRVIKFPLGRLFNVDNDNEYGTDYAEQNYRCLKVSKFTLALVVCISAAITSEFLQRQLSGGRRTFDPLDMVYNVLGSLLGIAIAYKHE